jgi:hypothetical protein
MTPLILLGIILASTLVGVFGFLSNRQEHQDGLRAKQTVKYKERIRKLDNMIYGLPAAYLPKTLKVLIYASIIDSLKYMNLLAGGGDLTEQIETIRQVLARVLKSDSNSSQTDQEDISYSELKECKYLLKDLHSLILDFHNEGTMDKKTASSHLGTVRMIMLQVTLDTYNEAAIQALDNNNKNLALHYFSTALGRIKQSPEQEVSSQRSEYFQRKVEQLQNDIAIEESNTSNNHEAMPDAGVIAEWRALEQQENEWRKKRY